MHSDGRRVQANLAVMGMTLVTATMILWFAIRDLRQTLAAETGSLPILPAFEEADAEMVAVETLLTSIAIHRLPRHQFFSHDMPLESIHVLTQFTNREFARNGVGERHPCVKRERLCEMMPRASLGSVIAVAHVERVGPDSFEVRLQRGSVATRDGTIEEHFDQAFEYLVTRDPFGRVAKSLTKEWSWTVR